jgi:hypothetical protein
MRPGVGNAQPTNGKAIKEMHLPSVGRQEKGVET